MCGSLMNKEKVKKLFEYARESIKATFHNHKFKPEKVPAGLKEERGVFVTLTLNEQLRGCIGSTSQAPVWKSVITNARSSAFSDPRFQPLREEEFQKVIIELSLLSEPEETSLKDIKEGDGVIINQGLFSALFLPQVWEQLPSKEQFLSHLCTKAGLSPDCYTERETVFKKFKVEAWKEKTPGGSITRV
ncbi:AmmeMemoRadiSam system protein A [archaeon]|nr:AmmeMemoRadiSam system protein A [archaeon]